MSVKSVFGALLAALMALTMVADDASAQRRDRDRGDRDWELLGAEKVDFRRDRDVIRVGRKEGRFEALRLEVKDGDVRVREMTVVYGNGDKQRFEVDGIIRDGQRTRPIDWKGNTRFIREIEFRYKSVGRPRKGDERATVLVYGKEPDRRRARRGDDRRRGDGRRRGFGGRPEWVELGCRTVALFGADRDTIRVGRRDGRVKAIKSSAEGQKIYLINAKVVYSNGQPDTLEVAKTIPKNGETEAISVRGRTRSIDRIEIVSAKRPSLKRVKICVHGLQ